MGVGVARPAGAGPDTKEAYRRTESIGPPGPYGLSESSANTVAAQKVAGMAPPGDAKGGAAPRAGYEPSARGPEKGVVPGEDR